MSRILGMKRDTHTPVHILGSFVLTIHFYMVSLNLLLAGVLAWALAFLWEGADHANRAFGWNVPFLDPAGGDFGDIIADTIGVVWACLIITLML